MSSSPPPTDEKPELPPPEGAHPDGKHPPHPMQPPHGGGMPPGFNPAMMAAYPQMMQAGYFNPMMPFPGPSQMPPPYHMYPPIPKDTSITVEEGTPIFQANGSGRTREPFPEKLYRMMMEAEANNMADIIAFSGKGDTLVVMDKQRLQDEILPKYFKHGHWPSFQRQLYMYGFEKEPMGLEIYKHEGFVKGKPELLQMIARKKPGKTGDEGGHGGAKAFFPRRLYEAIMDAENSGLGHIIAFEPSGMAFRIHKPIGFFDEIAPKHFKFKHMSSLRRQLVYYGFEKVTSGPEKGAYRHQFFQKGHPELIHRVRRTYGDQKKATGGIGIEDPPSAAPEGVGAPPPAGEMV